MRTADRSEGLALLGSATVGSLLLPLPALMESGPPDPPRPGLTLSSLRAPSGTRRLRLSDGAAELVLDLPVLAPEIVGAGNGVHRVSEEAFLLHAPVADEGLTEVRSARPKLLILGNARALWNEGEPLVTAIRAIRTKVGAGPILWAPRVALPHRLPLLAYLGFDVLDTTEGELSASRGEFLDPTLRRVDPS